MKKAGIAAPKFLNGSNGLTANIAMRKTAHLEHWNIL